MASYRNRLLFLFFAPFLLIPQVMMAQTADRAEAVREIVKAFNIENHLQDAVDDQKSQFKTNPFGLPADKNEQMLNHYSEAFSMDSLMKAVHDTFIKDYEQEYADSTLEWLNRTDTQKVIAAKNEFYTIEGIRKRIVRMYEMEQDPPSNERKKLIQSIVAASSRAESKIDTHARIFRSFVNAFSSISEQQNFSSDQIDGFIDNYRTQIEPQIRNEVSNNLLIMFHDLDRETLTGYLNFFDTMAGLWLVNTIMKSKSTALDASSRRFRAFIDNR